MFYHFNTGASGGIDYATAEIEVDTSGHADMDEDRIVAVEPTDMDFFAANNFGQSTIPYLFPSARLSDTLSRGVSSPVANELDNHPTRYRPLTSDYAKTPTAPQELQLQDLSSCDTPTHFTSLFLYVEEEWDVFSDGMQWSGNKLSDHERELFTEYKMKEMDTIDSQKGECEAKNINVDKKEKKAVIMQRNHIEVEGTGLPDTYEKAVPTHGDIYLHKMICTISKNPGQVLR